MYYLGINPGRHDSAAALVKDGTIIAMAEQERFSRRKRAVGEAPIDAVEFCLSYAGITLADVDAIGLGWNFGRMREHGQNIDLDTTERLFPANRFPGPLPPVQSIDHHVAHAASCFGPSGFPEAAVLVVDGGGELESTTLGYYDGSQFHTLEQIQLPFSLGNYYAAATKYTGMKARDAGKFMGLAAYGRPDQHMPLQVGRHGLYLDRLPEFSPSGRFDDLDAFRATVLQHFTESSFPFAVGDGRDMYPFIGFAASVQHSLEQALLYLAERVKRLTGSRNLCLAGGVALNCSANGILARSGLFGNLFVQPAAHDSGVALGAALEIARCNGANLMQTGPMTQGYWGPSYSQEVIEDALCRHGIAYERLSEAQLIERTAHAIMEDKIVGWFQGRGEFGPRALGARSLLGNPRKRHMLTRLNALKGREAWRPLAPSVTAEAFNDFFESPHASPFMIVAAHVHPGRRHEIPAVVHVDGSARPQAVTRAANPRYWTLLTRLGDLTGIPVVINTSFNLDDEPIVNTPDEAINDFLRTDMEMLVIGDAIAVK